MRFFLTDPSMLEVLGSAAGCKKKSASWKTEMRNWPPVSTTKAKYKNARESKKQTGSKTI
jgi:hypothetical protein